MEGMREYMPWFLLFALCFLFFLLVHQQFKQKNVWATMLQKYKQNVEGAKESEAAFVARFGSVENHSLLYKIDRLVLLSGLKKQMPWLNGEWYIVIMLLAVVSGIMEGSIFAHNFYVALFLGLAQGVLLYAFALALSGRTYNQIEDSTSIFVSILANHAKGSSDIVSIMQSTYYSMDGPIKERIGRFLLDAEQTGNVDLAFDYMKESVENRQLQTVLVNLKNCMHYQANYEEVLAQMMGQIAENLSAREDRKNILFSMKLTLVVISIASVLIVVLIGNGIGVDVKEILTSNKIGQTILFVTGLLYLFVVMKLFGTDKQ